VVRTWKSAFQPSGSVHFLDNGHMLRGANDPGTAAPRGGGQGGRFQEFDFDGNLVWNFRFNDGRLPHHDVAVLPNGNILAIVWETKTANEARHAGRREERIPPGGIWPDMLIEFEPQRPDGARIVWEWHMWDHLIQNVDPTLDNYGDPALHPGRIDINAGGAGAGLPSSDVFHTNAVSYNADFDQVLLSIPTFNEVWVIDHSTTTQEAAGETGGRSGKGGSLLYRWGNPQAYSRGAEVDRMLGFQHDARWIPRGRPGAGRMTVFSNRTPGATTPYSTVYEFVPPADAEGRYAVPDTAPFGPVAPVWTYASPADLQAANLSGAERLENGNTLISEGPEGRLFEVTPAGAIVWEYWSPYSNATGAGAFSLFRATRVRPDFPGLVGQDLRPMDPQPPISASASTGTSVGTCPLLPSRPELTSIVPSVGARGAGVPLDITLTGTNLLAGLTLDVGDDIEVSEIHAVDSTRVTARLLVAATAARGPRPVTVTTTGGASAAVVFNVVDPFPDLSITSSHTGTFPAGFDQTYVVTITNVGAAPTTGAIVVIDSLPAGLTFLSATGSGWSCSAAEQVIHCGFTEVLSPGASARYALNVATGGAASSVNHFVSVAAVGDLNDANDSASDVTVVVSPSPVFAFTPYPLVPGRPATVRVTMATAFPYDVTGSVAMDFAPSAAIAADDPAIQFSTGGRTVSFVIPANETEARFGSALQPGPLGFQTGTVAGALAFTGRFNAGVLEGLLLFPPGTGALTIPLEAPRIQSVQTNNEGGFAVSILLFSTPREVTDVNLSFETKPKIQLSCGAITACSVSGNTLTLDVRTLFAQWFSGTPAFGGLARLRLSFAIQKGTVSGDVSVTLKNTHGVSNAVSFPLP
jgi:uncharacterized repeat protein (TIGR01451 family)